MTDRTTEVLRKTMAAIVEVAPPPPDLPAVPQGQRGRRWNPVLVAAGAFTVTLLVLGSVLFYLSGDSGQGEQTAAPGSAPAAPTRTPDVIIWLFDAPDDESLAQFANQVLDWEHVVFAEPWDRTLTLADFNEMFADQPEILAIVAEDPSVLPVSVRVWLDGPGAAPIVVAVAEALGLTAEIPSVETTPGSTEPVAATTPPSTPLMACSALDEPVVVAPQPDLPTPVEDTRQAIVRAASGCDYGALDVLAQRGPNAFEYDLEESFASPAALWRSLERQGYRPMALLASVLSQPPTTVATQGDGTTYYRWGSAGDAGSDQPRIGISEAGDWLFMVIGELHVPSDWVDTTIPLTCSAAGLSPTPGDQPGLPAQVAEARRVIVAAAVSCELDVVGGLGLQGEEDFLFGWGDVGDAGPLWRRLEWDGDAPMSILVGLLDLPYSREATSDGMGYYQWPNGVADRWLDLSASEKDAIRLVVGDEAYREAETTGEYLGPRLGIADTGEWLFFLVAGD